MYIKFGMNTWSMKKIVLTTVLKFDITKYLPTKNQSPGRGIDIH